MKEGLVPDGHPLAPVTKWQPLLVFLDGPEHKRLRDAVTDSLARFEARGIRRHVMRHAHDAIDAMVRSRRYAQPDRTDSRQSGEPSAALADLVEQYANPVPLKVITSLFGMEEDYESLVTDARTMISGGPTAAEAGARVTHTLHAVVQRKRRHPGGDLPSVLLGHGLNDEEVRETLRLVMSAAYEPTAQLICDSLAAFLGDAKARGQLSGGHITLPEAMDDVLWNQPPMMTNIGRWATGDTELGGRKIREGDMLLLGLAAGNNDPAARASGQSVRGNRAHLAFSTGSHECPGAVTGRGIAETAIDVLMERLPGARLTMAPEALPRKASLMINQIREMPVTWDKAGAEQILDRREQQKYAPHVPKGRERVHVPAPNTAARTVPVVPIS
ncbi:cytochrome P450 [Streptomyces sp. PU-14G]|uniref:cytochrome P450 n=1 Tax=Streptomyces sp. PU-14G TaxID=2800808 RepID=UPI0034DF6790